MAMDFTNAKQKQSVEKSLTLDQSSDLKKLMTEKQATYAKKKFYDIRKAFYDSGCPITRHDEELLELIRLKIIDTLLVEGF